MARTVPSVTVLFLMFMTAKAFELEIIPAVKVAAQIGGKLMLICRTSGCESPVFSWRTQLDSPLGGTVSNEGSTSNLTMNPVTFENDHAYLCSAHCGSEKKEKGIKVELYSFPSDPVIMISKPLYAGEKSSIICKIPNVYPADRLVIQLQKGGELPSRKEFYDDPSDKTTETKWMWYHFTPTIEDTGKEITCMAELPIAEMEFEPKKRQTSEKLIVSFGPQNTAITVSPNATVGVGSTVVLYCMSESNPPAKILWGKRQDDKSVWHIMENHTLTIPHAQLSDSGLYICEAINAAVNKTQRTTVSISIQVPPKDTMLLAFPSDAVKEGDSVTISCTSTGNPAVHIVLKKKMGDVDQVLDSEGGNYTIDRTQMEHAGVYKCESRNELGQQFQNITLNVKVPPQNTTVLIYPSESVNEGVNVTITCTTYSNPPPEIILKKVYPYNKTILSSKNGTFTLYNVTRNDTGKYLVNVSNEAGTDIEVIEIAVIGRTVEPEYVKPVIIVLSCLSVLTIPAVAVLVYLSRKAKINGSYHVANAPGPKV
ncbi:vascular cell adhesion protein 1 isoform X1 [Alligator sinensis]|uniref:Vascular cell adhesion protein 1 isoform X1 n=1 Tax=Alligator sinensis TaxID=38654 RepID=A0A1U7RBK9_ALLSI|nr:vascular cell adhesion protein 1 isoform X1 [Alligator sinensis]